MVISTQLLPAVARAERITNGLVALYYLNEGTGEIIKDSSTNPLNLRIPAGHLSNNVHWPGTGGCMATAGICIVGNTAIATDQGAVKLSDTLTMTDDITIEAWVRPANATQGNDFEGAQIVNMALGNDVGFTLNQMGDTYGGGVRSSGGVVGQLKTPAGAAKAGVLQHVVYTSSNDSGTANIYVDNAQLNSRSASFAIIADAANPLAIGGRPQAIHPWHGEIFLVAIYNRALSLNEIGENFRAGANPEIPEPSTLFIGLLGLLNIVSFVRWDLVRYRRS
jgi:hypothetical protein